MLHLICLLLVTDNIVAHSTLPNSKLTFNAWEAWHTCCELRIRILIALMNEFVKESFMNEINKTLQKLVMSLCLENLMDFKNVIKNI